MSMRMVPIKATLQKMHRLVRDIAAKQKKEVQLVLEGEETEIDRTIVEKISDPLMHMVRNAVDHAIELPEERVALGKSPTGTIRIRAFHKSGNVVIEIEDDGQGLNRERIKEKAFKNGLLKPGAKPDDKELLNLILRPGFSTADVVTSISGRGVGLDVVQKNISKLRGKIEIKSVPRRGTLFTIRLPLTLAIIDGLIIRVADNAIFYRPFPCGNLFIRNRAPSPRCRARSNLCRCGRNSFLFSGCANISNSKRAPITPVTES